MRRVRQGSRIDQAFHNSRILFRASMSFPKLQRVQSPVEDHIRCIHKWSCMTLKALEGGLFDSDVGHWPPPVFRYGNTKIQMIYIKCQAPSSIRYHDAGGPPDRPAISAIRLAMRLAADFRGSLARCAYRAVVCTWL